MTWAVSGWQHYQFPHPSGGLSGVITQDPTSGCRLLPEKLANQPDTLMLKAGEPKRAKSGQIMRRTSVKQRA